MTNSPATPPSDCGSIAVRSNNDIGQLVGDALRRESQQALGESISVPVFRTRKQRSFIARPSVAVPLSFVIICALTTVAAGQLRDKPQKTTELAVDPGTGQTADDLPHYILDKQGYSPDSIERWPDKEALLRQRTFSVTFKEKSYTLTTWIEGGPLSPDSPDDPGSNTVINGRPTRLIKDTANWYALQVRNGAQAMIFGEGPIDRTALGKLFDIRLRDDLTLDESTVPDGASVIAMPIEPPSYSITYVRARKGDDPVRLGVSSSPRESPAESTKVTRDGRVYQVVTPVEPPNKPQDIPATKGVFWDAPGGVRMFLNASSAGALPSDDALVDLASAVRLATSREWALVLRGSGDSPVLKATDAVTADGVEIPVRFEMDAAELTQSCRNVLLRWTINHELNEGTPTCVSGSEPGPFKLLSAEKVNNVPVVYGLTPLEGENQVVVITDAEGYVVGEDVTLDNPIMKLRSFAIGLPDDAVAPFTVELYDFDRAWYVEDPTREPKSYVRPDQEPFATTQLGLR